MSKKLTEEELNLLKEYFKSLELKNWQLCGNPNNSGGQAQVLEVRNIKTNEIGVFRVLRKIDDKESQKLEIKRFYRELEVLKACSHPNIIKLLDYTNDQDNQWYISKKGKDFKLFWDSFVQVNIYNPDVILNKAIKIVSSLCDGLSDLHKKGIVHRDIKYGNIVIDDDDNPILIDFGISFIDGEERVSDMPVCNMLGIDAASGLDGVVVPWLDVFLLSQLLIKMISDRSEKQKALNGPRDWRFVSYTGISESNQQKIIAITASCYNRFTSPKNATELKSLIENLFNNEEVKGDDEFKKKVSKIQCVLMDNKASDILKGSEAFSLIESRLPLLFSIAIMFKDGILNIFKDLTQGFEVSLEIDDLDNKKFSEKFYKQFEKEYLGTTNFLYVTKNGVKLYCRWTLRLWTYDLAGGNRLINVPHIEYAVNDSNDKLAQAGPMSINRNIVPREDGNIDVYDGNLNLVRTNSIEEEIKIIKDQLLDEGYWSIASR